MNERQLFCLIAVSGNHQSNNINLILKIPFKTIKSCLLFCQFSRIMPWTVIVATQ